jgi:phage repressor protein C with HTH and peptisase S24 domain
MGTTFYDRINLAFNRENERRLAASEPRLTKTALWKTAGLSSGAASHWFDGSNGADLDTCEKIAPLMRVNARWLFDGTDGMPSNGNNKKIVSGHDETGGEPISAGVAKANTLGYAEYELEQAPDVRPYRQIPVVGEVQGGDGGYLVELEYPVGHGDGVIEWIVGDPEAYALRVRGDSMRPRYRPGEFVLVQPNVVAQPGDDVVVICKDGRKMLKELAWIRDDEAQFVSINTDYAPITIRLADIDSIQSAGHCPRSAFKRT